MCQKYPTYHYGQQSVCVCEWVHADRMSFVHDCSPNLDSHSDNLSTALSRVSLLSIISDVCIRHVSVELTPRSRSVSLSIIYVKTLRNNNNEQSRQFEHDNSTTVKLGISV